MMLFTRNCTIFSVNTEPANRLNFKPYEWFYDLPMRRVSLYRTWSRQPFDLDVCYYQGSSPPPPLFVESGCACRCHLHDHIFYFKILGSEVIKNTTFFLSSSTRPNFTRIYSGKPLPFENSDGQGVHTVPVKLLIVPSKNSSPVSAFKFWNR